MKPFLTGQRWISDTEPELGLGTVVSADARQVSVHFGAAHVTRVYAAEGAPLSRAVFAPGDMISLPEGPHCSVHSVTERDGLIVYAVEGGEIPETHLGDAVPCSRPHMRLIRGTPDTPDLYALRHDCWRYHARLRESGVHGLNGARIDLLPHQLYTASEATKRLSVRILLADEVGLGKTIEACLILHRLLLTERVTRILIMVPETLVHQWFVELLRRFNLSVALYDEERCSAAEPNSPNSNPFMDEQIVLASESFFESYPRRVMQALEAEWDLLIVDEAHHLVWEPDAPDVLYRFVEQVSALTKNVLLLTATPEGAGPESHFSRLRLLDPDRYPDFQQFARESEGHVAIAKAVDQRLSEGQPVDELLDRYGPGRVIFRNTRKTVGGFPHREPHFYPLEPDADRAAWLAGLANRLAPEKILVIGSTRAKMEAMADELRTHSAIKSALFHEDMSIIQRDRSAAWFSEPDGARLLLCSEIGGEGRNFQFAHHLVLFDIPENPELLEQRIGRLDRIGQREVMHIHVPYETGSREERLVRWLRDGLQAFAHCLRGGARLHGQFQHELDSADIDSLVTRTRAARDALYEKLDHGTSRLLELHSLNTQVAGQVIASVEDLETDADFEPFLLRLLDCFGIHADRIEHHSYRLSPGPTFRDGLPQFEKEGMTITVDRETALNREDWVFMTWDHPLVAAGMEQLIASQEGSCAFVGAEHGSGRRLLLEAMFILEVTAPPALNADRFLSTTPLRISVDMNLERRADLPLDLPAADRTLLHSAGEMLGRQLEEMVASARAHGEQEAAARRTAACEQMHRELGAELARLKHLAEVNDHVHTEEVSEMESRIRRVESSLKESALRLDSVRLIVA